MTNGEIRMTKQFRMTNDEALSPFRHSDFVIDSSFVIRHSTLMGGKHARFV